MTTIRFIGDVHAKWFDYYHEAKHSPSPTIQVGDFGCGFNTHDWDQIHDLQKNGDHRFIRGNHDDPHAVRDLPGFIEDGTVEGNMMFIGGAWSIDYQWRTPGTNWWPDEECNQIQFEKFIDTYTDVKPDIMVTHDFPREAARVMFFDGSVPLLSGGIQYDTMTSEAFQEMFEIHQPKLWIGGHWHHNMDVLFKDTRFICLAELEYCDVNIDTFEVIYD